MTSELELAALRQLNSERGLLVGGGGLAALQRLGFDLDRGCMAPLARAVAIVSFWATTCPASEGESATIRRFRNISPTIPWR